MRLEGRARVTRYSDVIGAVRRSVTIGGVIGEWCPSVELTVAKSFISGAKAPGRDKRRCCPYCLVTLDSSDGPWAL